MTQLHTISVLLIIDILSISLILTTFPLLLEGRKVGCYSVTASHHLILLNHSHSIHKPNPYNRMGELNSLPRALNISITAVPNFTLASAATNAQRLRISRACVCLYCSLIARSKISSLVDWTIPSSSASTSYSALEKLSITPDVQQSVHRHPKPLTTPVLA